MPGDPNRGGVGSTTADVTALRQQGSAATGFRQAVTRRRWRGWSPPAATAGELGCAQRVFEGRPRPQGLGISAMFTRGFVLL
ncbi:hypothetical protein [Streptomyces sp. N35]|uniref:hypothetical protein n=1 Tax=Streptomyces sp. N35 TaxID=2795730 RepID=UPI0018F5E1D3|nr:hypothetical protein [Streptomyces sp. N35]